MQSEGLGALRNLPDTTTANSAWLTVLHLTTNKSIRSSPAVTNRPRTGPERVAQPKGGSVHLPDQQVIMKLHRCSACVRSWEHSRRAGVTGMGRPPAAQYGSIITGSNRTKEQAASAAWRLQAANCTAAVSIHPIRHLARLPVRNQVHCVRMKRAPVLQTDQLSGDTNAHTLWTSGTDSGKVHRSWRAGVCTGKKKRNTANAPVRD